MGRGLVVERRGYLGFIEAGEAAEVLDRDEGTGGLAGGLAGAAHEPLGRVVAAAGEGGHVLGINADARREHIGAEWGKRGTTKIIQGEAPLASFHEKCN